VIGEPLFRFKSEGRDRGCAAVDACERLREDESWQPLGAQLPSCDPSLRELRSEKTSVLGFQKIESRNIRLGFRLLVF
jgi:hypothetical protein